MLTQNLLSRCSGSSNFIEMVTHYRLWRANHIKVRYLRRFSEGFLSSTILRYTLEEHKSSNNIFLRQQTTKLFLHRISHQKQNLTIPHIPSYWRCLLQEHRCFEMCDSKLTCTEGSSGRPLNRYVEQNRTRKRVMNWDTGSDCLGSKSWLHHLFYRSPILFSISANLIIILH